MNLVDFRANIKLTLGMRDGAQLTEGELDRAVNLAVSVLNRHIANQKIVTHVWTKTITAEVITNSHDVAVALANNPIKFGSEIVTDNPNTETYVRDTDYEMDYINGTITALSTGGMSDDPADSLVTYERDRFMFNADSLMTEPVSINLIDVRSKDEAPRILERWQKFGAFVILIGKETRGQESVGLNDNDHINIYYNAMHTEPTASTDGSFPRYLDEVIVIGASGYALCIKGFEREQQSITDLASSRAELDLTAALHGNIGTVFTAMSTPLGDIDNALNSAAGKFGEADTILASADTEIALAKPEILKYDAVDGPIQQMANALVIAKTNLVTVESRVNLASNKINGLANSSSVALGQIDAELAKVITAADNMLVELVSGTISADKYLTAGDDLLNSINDATDAPGDHRLYAETKIRMAQIYANEGGVRINYATTRVNEATARIGEARSIIGEATILINNAQTSLAIAAGHGQQATLHLAAAREYSTVGLAYIQEATAKIGIGLGYVQEARERVNTVNAYLGQITAYLTQIVQHIAESAQYQNIADRERAIGLAMRAQGLDYVRAFMGVVRERSIGYQSNAMGAVRQHPS